MKTKFITALVAFFATFIFAGGLALYFTPIDVNRVTAFNLVKTDKRVARQISELLRQDISNGSLRRDSNSNIDDSTGVSEYSKKSAQMNVDSLPADFQNAWYKHMNAWHNYADFLEDATNPNSETRYDERGIRQVAIEHNSKINTTWYQVLISARNYGAEIPKGAY